MGILIGILEQGMIYAIMALGVYITYKILDFPDMTVDGSFPLGAAITVLLLTGTESSFINSITFGFNPYIISFYAFLSGAVAGFVTGIIHVKFKVRDLFSGIISMTGLYSINLRIAGRANVPIFNLDTIFDNSAIDRILIGALEGYKVAIVVSIIAAIVLIILGIFLSTEAGYLIKAAGNNPTFVKSLGVNSGNIKIMGLALANGLVALSGSVMMQQQGFFEISMGTGAMVISLASVIIGTNLFKNSSLIAPLVAVVIGSIIYKLSISMAMAINFASASDMKLITSIIFLIILVFGNDKKKIFIKS